MSFFVKGLTNVNQDFFNRIASIKLLYTVVGFQLKFTKKSTSVKGGVVKGVISDVSAQKLHVQHAFLRCIYEANARSNTPAPIWKVDHRGYPLPKQGCPYMAPMRGYLIHKNRDIPYWGDRDIPV